MSRAFLWSLLLSVVPTLSGSVCAQAEEPAAAESGEDDSQAATDAESKARLDYMIKAMRKFEIELDAEPNRKAVLDPKAMLRWSNPVSDVPDGLLAIYATDSKARPAVIAQYHAHGNGFEVHEFAGVYPGTFSMMRGTRKLWRPESRYGEFKKIEDAPPPADTAVRRLSQMKQLAERFVVYDNFRAADDKPQREALRLMSRPVYRYGDEKSSLKDGAVFSFVLATDPEASLLLEAHEEASQVWWEYALFPMSIYALEGQLDGKDVWKKPEAMVFNSPTAPHYVGPYRGDDGEVKMQALLPKKAP